MFLSLSLYQSKLFVNYIILREFKHLTFYTEPLFLRFLSAHYSLSSVLDADGVVGCAGECSALCWTEADIQVRSLSLDLMTSPAVGGILITGRLTPEMKRADVLQPGNIVLNLYLFYEICRRIISELY